MIEYSDVKRNGELDLLSGGAPCQAFSYAGKRLGLEDARGTSEKSFKCMGLWCGTKKREAYNNRN